MKRFLVSLLLVVIVVLTASPAFAMEACDHEMVHEATIASLDMHVHHAYDMAHINNQGVYTSLQATLARAQSFGQAGQPEKAIQQLDVFIMKVEAQAGITIDATCAEHLIMHAEHVQMALGGEM